MHPRVLGPDAVTAQTYWARCATGPIKRAARQPRTPRHPALFEDTEYTYAQLDALAGGLAAGLKERGVKPGDRVALMSSNRPNG
jgi:acyl-CoA synthetase (AMP-forming)/AMP-acid ligase II